MVTDKPTQSETEPLSRQPLEVDTNTAASNVNNPYTSRDQAIGGSSRMFRKMKSMFFLSLSLYFLHIEELYHNILHSSHIDHTWLSLGLASTVLTLGLKTYTELYEGKMKQKEVNYENYKQITHAIMLLFLFTSICFHLALWPVYGSKTFMLAFATGFGVILQYMLIFPVIVQNLVGFAALTFFIQQYAYL